MAQTGSLDIFLSEFNVVDPACWHEELNTISDFLAPYFLAYLVPGGLSEAFLLAVKCLRNSLFAAWRSLVHWCLAAGRVRLCPPGTGTHCPLHEDDRVFQGLSRVILMRLTSS